jgi:hypothetical protein
MRTMVLNILQAKLGQNATASEFQWPDPSGGLKLVLSSVNQVA